MNEEHDPETVVERLVHDAERAADRSLARYKIRLGLFAVLGYVVIFAIIAALFALVGGVVAASLYSTALLIILIKKKLIFILIPAIWILLKSLWVKLEAPTGYVLTAKTCASLFAEIDRLRNELKALKIHQVILTPELNAAISQTPRWGVFGWQKNTLILGLELLLTLTSEQARAVIAHEFGHLSGNHSRFSGWIYRVRQSWHRIMLAYHEEASLGARLMRPFFDWYAPRFAAYSFVLAQRNEYEADAIAAELTSAEDTSGALVTTHVTGPYIDENYWDEYFKLADSTEDPEQLPWQGLSRFLASHDVARSNLQSKLDQALAFETGLDDTHPCLSDRISALAAEGAVPQPIELTAAQSWLGAQKGS